MVPSNDKEKKEKDIEPEFGLDEDWFSVQKTLESIIPVYDKTNRFISLGTDLKLRKKGIQILLNSTPGGLIVDLGCGTGKMSKELIEEAPLRQSSTVLLDPILPMARVARSRTRLDAVISVFESLPFQKNKFAGAMAGFAIRDSKILQKAFQEISTILSPDGKLLVVDLSKPNSAVSSWIIGVYWRVFAPLIAILSSGRKGLKFGALAKTFQKLPKSSDFIKLAERSGFQVSFSQYSMMGGACVLLFSKIKKEASSSHDLE